MRHLTQPSHTHNSKQWFSPRAAGRVQPSLSDVWFLVRVLYTEPRRSVSEDAALTCRAERVSAQEKSSTDHIVEGLLQERAGAGGLAAHARLPPRQAGRAAQQHRAVGVAPAGEGGARPAQTVGDRAPQLQYRVRSVQGVVQYRGDRQGVRGLLQQVGGAPPPVCTAVPPAVQCSRVQFSRSTCWAGLQGSRGCCRGTRQSSQEPANILILPLILQY